MGAVRMASSRSRRRMRIDAVLPMAGPPQAHRQQGGPHACRPSPAGSPADMFLLARMIKLAAALVVGVIVAGILCHVLGANASNGVVSAVYDVDKVLVGPFRGLFSLRDHKLEIAINWGIAAALYALVGALLARLLLAAGAAGSGSGPGWGWRRRRA